MPLQWLRFRLSPSHEVDQSLGTRAALKARRKRSQVDAMEIDSVPPFLFPKELRTLLVMLVVEEKMYPALINNIFPSAFYTRVYFFVNRESHIYIFTNILELSLTLEITLFFLK